MIVFFATSSVSTSGHQLAVTDQDRTQASHELVQAFEAGGRFR